MDIKSLIHDSYRKRICFLHKGSNVYRLVNSTSDNIPGLFADIYGDHIVVQCESKKIADYKKDIVKSLIELFSPKSIFEKSNSWIAKNNNTYHVGFLFGEESRYFLCKEMNIALLVNPMMAKTGYFIDLRDVRNFVETHSYKKTVLNCYAFTCSIGAFALRGGAYRVINVDKKLEVLELGKKNYRLNKLKVRNDDFVVSDVYSYLLQQVRQIYQYDMIVLDPPEFIIQYNQEDIKRVTEIYRLINTLALQLLSDKGILITTSCSHGYPKKYFRQLIFDLIQKEFPEVNVIQEFDTPLDHPVCLSDSSLDYLTVFALQKNRSSH